MGLNSLLRSTGSAFGDSASWGVRECADLDSRASAAANFRRILECRPASHGDSSQTAGNGAKSRSACSVSRRQWATQTDEENLKPASSEELESANLSANPKMDLKSTNSDSASLPRPLSLTDLAPPPSHGSQIRVAYQGVPGAYSEAAALKAYPQCEAVPCEQFEAAFQAVELWIVDRAVLPIENCLDGSIHRNYDLLLRHHLHIVGEVQLAVHHCLLGNPDVKKEEIKRVVSHPQALSQCEKVLSKMDIIRESVDDTAGAAQFIAAHNLRDTGAIASARAAEIYHLDILADGIQDDSDNVTRFLMLAREPIIPRTDRPFKTSIVFTLDEGPGVVFKALAVFALRNINLTKIESRPQRKRPLRVVDDSNDGIAKYFDYLFYIDFEASMADPRAQNALGHLQTCKAFAHVDCKWMDEWVERTTNRCSAKVHEGVCNLPPSIGQLSYGHDSYESILSFLELQILTGLFLQWRTIFNFIHLFCG